LRLARARCWRRCAQRSRRTRTHDFAADARSRRWTSTSCRYIVVEGPIGAGKTSLARELARRVDGEALLEKPEDNPFLERFYEDMARFALPTQLTFLFQRVDQLRSVGQFDMFRRATVGDFLLDKDPLFARLNLSDAEFRLYEKVIAAEARGAGPDLVIYLQAPVETLIERVHRVASISSARSPPTTSRGSPTPTAATFYAYGAAPLLIVNSERLNFVDDPTTSTSCAPGSAMRGQREFFNLGQAA
jgi:hypothetical protein